MTDIVERLREDARGGFAYHELSDEAADEIEQLRKIRELCIKALMVATGATRQAIEASPVTCAKEATDRLERLRYRLRKVAESGPAERYWEGRWRDAEAENDQLRAALALIADIAEGSTTPNSLPHIVRIARDALEQKP